MSASYISEEDLTDKDKTWVLDQIEATPRMRWARWFKDWGTAGAFITACVAVAIYTGTQISGNSKFQGATEQHFQGIELQLTSLRALIVASQPGRAQNQKAAQELLAAARSGKIQPILVTDVEQAGKSFIGEAQVEPKAWDVAKEFLDYRSALNAADFLPAQQALYTPIVPSELVRYEFNIPLGRERPIQFSLGGAVPIQNGARVEHLDNPLNQQNQNGNKSILFVGGAIDVDGLLLRHVVFRNVEIHYTGAPAILEDVMFVNCHFVFDNTPNTRSLGEQILTSTRVNVSLAPA